MFRKLEDITPDMYEELNKEIEQYFDEGCHGNCASCKKDCSSPLYPRYAKSLFAVTGGKGGTGKSTVTALLAAEIARRGFKVGVLDADIFCGVQPRLFGESRRLRYTEFNGEQILNPVQTKDGVKLISYDLIGDNGTAQPVLLPDSEASKLVSLFYTNGAWDGLDIILVDMPSGAGDVPMDLYSSLPVEGVIIVSEPGELGVMATQRCINLCSMLMSPPVAFIENKALDERCTSDGLYSLPGAEKCLRTWLPLSPEIAMLGNGYELSSVRAETLDPVVERLLAKCK